MEDKYIIDLTNKFILQMQENGDLNIIDSEYIGDLKFYQESNIAVVGNILEKYYMYKKLGIKSVYS